MFNIRLHFLQMKIIYHLNLELEKLQRSVFQAIQFNCFMSLLFLNVLGINSFKWDFYTSQCMYAKKKPPEVRYSENQIKQPCWKTSNMLIRFLKIKVTSQPLKEPNENYQTFLRKKKMHGHNKFFYSLTSFRWHLISNACIRWILKSW